MVAARVAPEGVSYGILKAGRPTLTLHLYDNPGFVSVVQSDSPSVRTPRDARSFINFLARVCVGGLTYARAKKLGLRPSFGEAFRVTIAAEGK